MPRNYILIIAEVSNRILRLPKSSLSHTATVQARKRPAQHAQQSSATSNDDLSEDDEEEKEDDEDDMFEMDNDSVQDQNTRYSQKKNSQIRNQSKSEQHQEAITSSQLTELEQRCLLESIEFLNEIQRVQFIVKSLENYLQDEQLLNALCEICHNLMIYNRMAILEYK